MPATSHPARDHRPDTAVGAHRLMSRVAVVALCLVLLAILVSLWLVAGLGTGLSRWFGGFL